VAELEEGKQYMNTKDTTKKITEITFNDKDSVRAVANKRADRIASELGGSR
jgi:hypothetical protein